MEITKQKITDAITELEDVFNKNFKYSKNGTKEMYNINILLENIQNENIKVHLLNHAKKICTQLPSFEELEDNMLERIETVNKYNSELQEGYTEIVLMNKKSKSNEIINIRKTDEKNCNIIVQISNTTIESLPIKIYQQLYLVDLLIKNNNLEIKKIIYQIGRIEKLF